MNTNNLIYFGLAYFVDGNQIKMVNWRNDAEWKSRVVPAIQLLERYGLVTTTLENGTFCPATAVLTDVGKKRRNKELRVNI